MEQSFELILGEFILILVVLLSTESLQKKRSRSSGFQP
nr:MAG TPA: chitin synthase regulator [Caudoviricetes sp.]DAS54393.1 MAG TPA: chitin synthase regulator [Caudoviricetes sp.]